MVELLCSYGADVNMKDNSGSSPYDVARMLGMQQRKGGWVGVARSVTDPCTCGFSC